MNFGARVYQQNLKGRKLAIVALEHSQWPMVKLVAAAVAAAVDLAQPGGYVEVEVPFKDYSIGSPRRVCSSPRCRARYPPLHNESCERWL